MKRKIIQYTTILLAFLAGAGFMDYTTRMGNRDMTAVMAEATLPVAYAEKDGQLYNEMHGYVEEMDGSYMKDSVIGISEDHQIGFAVEKYNAQIEAVSYEVRTLDMSRLIESGEGLTGTDDGKYLHYTLKLKDLLSEGEEYLLLLKLDTEEQKQICYYSQLVYLGENYVQECVDFALGFHEDAVNQNADSIYWSKLEPDTAQMDGTDLGYVNIHSRSGPVTWGSMQIEQITENYLNFTELSRNLAALELRYQVKNTETEEIYEVWEAFRIRYTGTRMYLLAYERKTDQVFMPGRQLVENGQLNFGIQSREPEYKKNREENVIGFVRQGQLWSYDFGQNRLSRVYGFQDGDDERGSYVGHGFRILEVEDSGSMDFLVFGYMGRGRYEGRNGVLLCHYDALLNTVEEQFFLPSPHPYEALKEEIGMLAVENENGAAWLLWRGMILQIDLDSCQVSILSDNMDETQLKVSSDGSMAAWTAEEGEAIRLLDTRTGKISRIGAGSGEKLRALGFMDEDFIYGIASEQDIQVDMAGRELFPMGRIVIRNSAGQAVREFHYAEKGKYVTEVSIVENRIDLSCVTKLADGSYEETLPEPVTYTTDTVDEKLRLQKISDQTKRNEYHFVYKGTLKEGAMKMPKVKLVLFENNRTLSLEKTGSERYLAYSFFGEAESFGTLAEAVSCAYEEMGSVWKNGSCFWIREDRPIRKQLAGFEIPEAMEGAGSSLAQCVQALLRQKQIYADVQSELDEGAQVWQLLEKYLGENACILADCSLDMALYCVASGVPVLAVTGREEAVLITGFDAQNIVYYMPGEAELQKGGKKDSSAWFESCGNLFFTCLP